MTSRLLEFVQHATAFDPAESMLPFNIGMARVGWLKSSFAEELNTWPELFSVRPRGVAIIGDFDSAEHRSTAIGEAVEALASAGYIQGWRNEQIEVREHFGAEPQFHMERAAGRYFGITVYGVHLNGLTVRDGQPHMWLARRAATKNIDPLKLDNLCAGRISRGHTVASTLVKEAAEEAGISEALVRQAKTAGATHTCHEVERGLHDEIVFVHDLIAPADFQPQNQDGEVAEFRCTPVTEVIHLLDQTPDQFTTDAALVIVDCLIRRGYLTPERADFVDLIRAMRV